MLRPSRRPWISLFRKTPPVPAAWGQQNERSQNTLLSNCATRSLLSHWPAARWHALTRADSCEQVVCGWQRLASHTNSGAANVSWAGWAPRAIYFFRWGYSIVQESASQKDRALFWARRRCLSRRERDEDDHCVMSSCVTVAVCSRSLSVSWIYLMYSAQVLLTCPFISYEKTLKRMNTALVSVKRQCTWYVA